MPEIWHKAIIIQILKHGKDNNIGKNWRPISLLCPAAKTPEELLLHKIPTHNPSYSAQLGFRAKHSTCTAQHGIRAKHSTCTALSTITADIAAGFSRNKAGSPNSASRARSDCCILQYVPSTTDRSHLQHQHTLNNPSLVPQQHAEQTSQCSFSAKVI